MLKKLTCIGLGVMLVVSLSGCGKENKINEYDKENKTQILVNKEIIRDADYSEGNIIVPYIDISNDEVAKINTFLREKVKEYKEREFTEIDGEKFYINGMNYSYYLDNRILSVLIEEHLNEGEGFNWCYTYNIDLVNNKVLKSEEIITQIINDEVRKKLDKKFLEEIDEYFLSSPYYDFEKEAATEQYVTAMDSFDVRIYVGEDKKVKIAVPCGLLYRHNELVLDTDINVNKLFDKKESTKKDSDIKDIPVLKSEVLNFSISDYKSKIINYDLPNYAKISNSASYSELIEKAYYAGIFPNEVLKLYGKYIPPYNGEESTHGGSCIYTATSTLNDGKYNYSFSNLANEFDKDNSWVEGKAGYGIGEKITVYMTYANEFCRGNMLEGYNEYYGEEIRQKGNYNATFNGIYIVNGYAQNEALYKANSRVKKLKLTIDDKEQYILELEDTMMPQIFDVNYKVSNQKKLYPIKAEFEILEVYKGEKYEDTAINTLTVGFDSDVMKGGR